MSTNWTCLSCGKQSYLSRKDARRLFRARFPDGSMSAYRCPAGNGWHMGHKPNQLRHGQITRDDLRRRQRGGYVL